MKKFYYLFILFVLISCGNKDDEKFTPLPISQQLINDRWKIIQPAIDSIKEGDLIVRCGNDHTSYALLDFSQQDKLFSHSGIAFKVDSVMHVFHNMAGDLNPNEIMRRDIVDSFLTPQNNIAFGIYRYDLTEDELQRLKEIVGMHYTNKLQFDMNFDLETDEKMYCVEMIAKSIQKATNNRIKFTTSMVTDELRQKYLKIALRKKVLPSPKAADQREYLAIDNLYINDHCREVYKHIFERNTGPVSIPPPESDTLKK